MLLASVLLPARLLFKNGDSITPLARGYSYLWRYFELISL